MSDDPTAPRASLATVAERRSPDAPLTWTARVENTSGRTIHVSNRIQSIEAEPDGTVLRVSTERPALADNVYVPFLNVETVPLAPGEHLDQEFTIPVPLRLHR